MSNSIMMYTSDQLAQITTIADLVCLLLSWNGAASGLYNAWSMALYMRSEGKKYNFTFTYAGQCQTFSGCQIIYLEAQSRCPSLNDLLADSNTMEGVIKVLFKLRIPLTGLYSAYPLALDMRSRGNKYIYTFVNPFVGSSNAGNLATIEPNTWKMNIDCIINTFCVCSANGGGCGC